MWTQANGLSHALPGAPGFEASRALKPRASDALVVRRILLGIAYIVVFYFVTIAIAGAIVGGIAGYAAGRAGTDPGEAGKLAGTEFSQEWGWLFLFLIISFVIVAVVKGWLPWTKNPKSA